MEKPVILYVCMYGQRGKVANPARGQLNRENEYFPASACACEFGLARRVRLSRPASACSFSTLRLNPVLTHGIPPVLSDGLHTYHQSQSGQSRVLAGHAIANCWHHYREPTGAGPLVLKVVLVTGAACSGTVSSWTKFCAPLFFHTHFTNIGM